MKMTHSILHTVNQSPFENSCLKHCLENYSEGDAILFIENGVFACLKTHTLAAQLVDKNCFALEADLLARGLDKLSRNKSIALIGYDRFVELSCEHDLVQSWY